MSKIIRNIPNSPLVVQTGKFTGRSPKDRYIVRSKQSEDFVEWGERNTEISLDQFNVLHQQIKTYFESKKTFLFEGNVIADHRYTYKINFETEESWYINFASNIFRQDNVLTNVNNINIFHAPFFQANIKDSELKNTNFVILNIDEKIILIGGTGYAGEIKKSVFSLLNYHLINDDVLPMHCSANFDSKNGTSIYFGLSGTGKTTLSSDSSKKLIGDDEHGWSDQGIFNVEGGCYAKVVGLNAIKEPEIFKASNSPNAIIENVVVDSDGNIDFDNTSITENTRSCYSLNAMDNVFLEENAPHPSNIIMLTCDAFGVLPPVSKLSIEQAIFHFVSGYTAKIAGTEAGVREPKATFSSCFGAPFMPRFIMDYAYLLEKRISQHQSRCWLINTGWWGGPYGTGSRIDLQTTRLILQKCINDSFDHNSFEKSKYYNLSFPTHLDSQKKITLNPVNKWVNEDTYRVASNKLLQLFKSNFINLNLGKNIILKKGSIYY